MSKQIGIVICNYNKADFVVNCIRSIMESSYQDFDLYVVDNASTDESVEKIRSEYGDKLTLIVNSENMGGSGGFNTGLREVLKKDYTYIMCVDNDVVFDKNAIKELHNFLEEHLDVGMAGSRAYFMDDPERIWSFSASIDFDRYVQVDNYRNCTDGDAVPEVVYCDYVPACAMMLRTAAVRKVGLMPEENFIYWDDMEWGYRFNQAGYKVAAYGKSKVWHKGGGRNAGNTFINYYIWRNRLRFFMKVLPPEDRERFADTVLTELFRMIYSCKLKGEDNIIKSVMYAFDDAVHGITGKAADYKILSRNTVKNRLQEALGEAKKVLVKFNGSFEGLGNIIRNIRKVNSNIQVVISIPEPENRNMAGSIDSLRQAVTQQFSDCEISKEYHPDEYQAHLVMCEHIFKIRADQQRDIYIDSWCNIVYSQEDFIYAGSFEQSKDLFMVCKKDLLLHSMC